MTRNSRRQFACLILIVLTIVGCNKVADFLRGNKDGDMKYCNIKKVAFKYYEAREMTFSYNASGNPVSVYMDPSGTAAPSRYFSYDKKNRLTRMIGVYNQDTTSFEVLRLYYHDSKDRIIRDTGWGFGHTSNGVPIDYYGKDVTHYEYDKWDRIIRISITELYPQPRQPLIYTYEYDADGNLIGDGLVYDNKISYRRTNKIWMFLDKNYSVNNAFRAKRYNNNHLPLQIDLPMNDQSAIFLYQNMQHSTFTYECR